MTLFATPENGIILLDQFPEEENYTGTAVRYRYTSFWHFGADLN